MRGERGVHPNSVPLFMGFSFASHWLLPCQGSATVSAKLPGAYPEGGDHHRSGGFDIVGLEQIGDDDDTAGSSGEDLGERLAGDAADAEGGDLGADFAFHGGDVLEADGGAPDLGGSGKKRAEADVVEAFFQSGAGLGERMSGAADEEGALDRG